MARKRLPRKLKKKQGWASLSDAEFQTIEKTSRRENRGFAAVCGDMVRLGIIAYPEWREANPLPARPTAVTLDLQTVLDVEGGTGLRSSTLQ